MQEKVLGNHSVNILLYFYEQIVLNCSCLGEIIFVRKNYFQLEISQLL